MIDILQHIQAIQREANRRRDGDSELISVVVRRTYDAPVADVWSALTEPVRLARWLSPVDGDLRAGGRFQVQGNAGGDILACESPTRLHLTWGAPSSLVEVRLASRGRRSTDLVLEHTVPVDIARSVAGALFVGPGWDAGVIALDLYLRGELPDAEQFHESSTAQEIGAASIDAWTAAITAAGTATPDEIAGARAAAQSQFAPDLS